MRKFKWSSPYNSYLQSKWCNAPESLHTIIRRSHSYITPGCMGHNHPRSERVFARHVAHGNKTNMLYWRFHQKEYADILHLLNPRT